MLVGEVGWLRDDLGRMDFHSQIADGEGTGRPHPRCHYVAECDTEKKQLEFFSFMLRTTIGN